MAFNGPVSVQLVDGATNLTTTPISGKIALDVSNTKDVTVSVPGILNVSMPTPATEYTVNIPALVKEFSIKSRDGGVLQFCYTSGQSGTNYITLNSGSVFNKDGIYSLVAIPIYFQCSKATTLELFYWS